MNKIHKLVIKVMDNTKECAVHNDAGNNKQNHMDIKAKINKIKNPVAESIIYFVEAEYFDINRFIPFIEKVSDDLHKIVPLYLYPDGSKKILNIKTPFSEFKYNTPNLLIDLIDYANKNFHDMLHAIDKKIYNIIKDSKLIVNEQKINFYGSVLTDEKNMTISHTPNNVKCKLSNKYNNTNIIKYNSRTYIKLMDKDGTKIPAYYGIKGFNLDEFNNFMNTHFGKKSNRCKNFLSHYILHPEIYIFKDEKSPNKEYIVSCKMGISEGEIKHNKSYIKSLIDNNEDTVVTENIKTITI